MFAVTPTSPALPPIAQPPDIPPVQQVAEIDQKRDLTSGDQDPRNSGGAQDRLKSDETNRSTAHGEAQRSAEIEQRGSEAAAPERLKPSLLSAASRILLAEPQETPDRAALAVSAAEPQQAEERIEASQDSTSEVETRIAAARDGYEKALQVFSMKGPVPYV